MRQFVKYKMTNSDYCYAKIYCLFFNVFSAFYTKKLRNIGENGKRLIKREKMKDLSWYNYY